MLKHIALTMSICCLGIAAFAQSDTSGNITADIFNRITKSITEYQLDTTAAPNDKLTKNILALRSLKGGFNINEAIAFKIEEDRRKNEVPKAELDKIAYFFQSGTGRKWLDNATIWIYRKNFTLKEMRRLVKFYKTSAGQKMATDFPIIMMQSLRAAEMIKEIYTQQLNKS